MYGMGTKNYNYENNSFTLLALTCMLLSSCNNELDEQQVAITDETNTVLGNRMEFLCLIMKQHF